MSQVAIRAALEQALEAITPALSTAWENVAFSPPAASVSYQRAVVMFAEPANTECGRSHQEQGVFKVTLMYPIQLGDAAARARSALVMAAFYRGRTVTSAGVTVTITKTPYVKGGTVDGDRWAVPIDITFKSGYIA